MLNQNKKVIITYKTTFIITLILCIILFIIVDTTTFGEYREKTEDYCSSRFFVVDKKDENTGAKVMLMNLKNTYLELMQIADIYDNVNIRIDNSIEENDNTSRTNELDSDTKSNSTNWRIFIPKINVDAPIKSGTSQNILATAVGHFEESEYWKGNVALAGHNRGYNCNYFEKLKYLEIGDKIIYSTENGTREYKVVLNKIIKQTDWSYIENTKDNRLTLITCVENMHDYRRCVQAVEI